MIRKEVMRPSILLFWVESLSESHAGPTSGHITSLQDSARRHPHLDPAQGTIYWNVIVSLEDTNARILALSYSSSSMIRTLM